MKLPLETTLPNWVWFASINDTKARRSERESRCASEVRPTEPPFYSSCHSVSNSRPCLTGNQGSVELALPTAVWPPSDGPMTAGWSTSPQFPSGPRPNHWSSSAFPRLSRCFPRLLYHFQGFAFAFRGLARSCQRSAGFFPTLVARFPRDGRPCPILVGILPWFCCRCHGLVRRCHWFCNPFPTLAGRFQWLIDL